MNEIKKLYKNVGLDNLWVERYNDGNGLEHENWYPSYKVMIKSMMEKNGWTLMEAQNVAKKECQKELLPFTAEKQIELIKWLSSKYGMYIVGKYSIGFGTCVREFCTQKNFEEVLIESINHLWQSLTSEEKQQIKEILE